jgi:hypothetical protein
MKVSQPLLIGFIVILAAFLGWVSYDELRRREAVVRENLQTSKPVTATSSPTTEPLEAQSKLMSPEPIQSQSIKPDSEQTSSSTSMSNETTPRDIPTPIIPQSTTTLASNEDPHNTPANAIEADTTSEAPETSLATETTTDGEPLVCSSFDQAGLLATFDASLAAFIGDASSTYGNQYGNLQYQLSSKSGTMTGEQGTVTTSYSGTVQELSTSEDVSANGVITANFAWDGCTWQLVDYSF